MNQFKHSFIFVLVSLFVVFFCTSCATLSSENIDTSTSMTTLTTTTTATTTKAPTPTTTKIVPSTTAQSISTSTVTTAQTTPITETLPLPKSIITPEDGAYNIPLHHIILDNYDYEMPVMPTTLPGAISFDSVSEFNTKLKNNDFDEDDIETFKRAFARDDIGIISIHPDYIYELQNLPSGEYISSVEWGGKDYSIRYSNAKGYEFTYFRTTENLYEFMQDYLSANLMTEVRFNNSKTLLNIKYAEKITEYGPMEIYVFDSPIQKNLQLHYQEFMYNNVKYLIARYYKSDFTLIYGRIFVFGNDGNCSISESTTPLTYDEILALKSVKVDEVSGEISLPKSIITPEDGAYNIPLHHIILDNYDYEMPAMPTTLPGVISFDSVSEFKTKLKNNDFSEDDIETFKRAFARDDIGIISIHPDYIYELQNLPGGEYISSVEWGGKDYSINYSNAKGDEFTYFRTTENLYEFMEEYFSSYLVSEIRSNNAKNIVNIRFTENITKFGPMEIYSYDSPTHKNLQLHYQEFMYNDVKYVIARYYESDSKLMYGSIFMYGNDSNCFIFESTTPLTYDQIIALKSAKVNVGVGDTKTTNTDMVDTSQLNSPVGFYSNLSDFLTQEQIKIYNKAQIVNSLFHGNADFIDTVHERLNNLNSNEPQYQISSSSIDYQKNKDHRFDFTTYFYNSIYDEYYVSDVRYFISSGAFRTFEDLKNLAVSVFTEKYFFELNSFAGGLSSFLEINDALYYLDTARGGKFGYDPSTIPDTYELISRSENEIHFNVIGYVRDSYDAPIETAHEESYPLTLTLTKSGWRFSLFSDCAINEDYEKYYKNRQ